MCGVGEVLMVGPDSGGGGGGGGGVEWRAEKRKSGGGWRRRQATQRGSRACGPSRPHVSARRSRPPRCFHHCKVVQTSGRRVLRSAMGDSVNESLSFPPTADVTFRRQVRLPCSLFDKKRPRGVLSAAFAGSLRNSGRSDQSKDVSLEFHRGGRSRRTLLPVSRGAWRRGAKVARGLRVFSQQESLY